MKFSFEEFSANLGLTGIPLKNAPFVYSATFSNGSALPDFFIFDKYKAEGILLPSPYAKGKWNILISGEVPLFGKTSKL